MFKIIAVQNRSNDWKTVSLVTPDGDALSDVSVNRTNKRGEVFPNFDAIIPGADIAGSIWNSPTNGKAYLFAPKVSKWGGRPAQSAAPAPSNDKLETILNRLTDVKFGQVNIEGKIDQIMRLLQIKQSTKVDNTDMDYPENNLEDTPF